MNASAVLIFTSLLAALAAPGAAYLPHRAHHQIMCSKLKPVRMLDVKSLEGPWLTVETLLLRNGYPEPVQDSKSNVCIRTSIFDASDNGLSMRSEVRLGTDRRRTGVSKLTIDDPQHTGRWTLNAKRPSTLNSEMLALGVRSSEFLVLAYCQPLPQDDEEDDEERPALWIKLLGRPSAHGGVAISSRELHSLRNKLAEMLGLNEFSSVRYNTSC